MQFAQHFGVLVQRRVQLARQRFVLLLQRPLRRPARSDHVQAHRFCFFSVLLALSLLARVGIAALVTRVAIDDQRVRCLTVYDHAVISMAVYDQGVTSVAVNDQIVFSMAF